MSQSLSLLWLGSLHLLDGVESDSLDGSFSLEDSLLLLFAGVVLLGLPVESPPGGGPSQLLGFDLSDREDSGSLVEVEGVPAVLVDDSLPVAGVDLPLRECAQLSLDDHVVINNDNFGFNILGIW